MSWKDIVKASYEHQAIIIEPFGNKFRVMEVTDYPENNRSEFLKDFDSIEEAREYADFTSKGRIMIADYTRNDILD